MNLHHGNTKLKTSFNLERVKEDSGLMKLFYVSQRLFQPLEFSLVRSLIGWIQDIKLRKREFDRLEKIWQFYQPSSCLSKKKCLFLAYFTKQNFFFYKKKRSKSTRQTHFFKMNQTSFI